MCLHCFIISVLIHYHEGVWIPLIGLTRRTSHTMQVQGFEMKGVSLVDIGVIFLNVISYSLNEWYLYIDN